MVERGQGNSVSIEVSRVQASVYPLSFYFNLFFACKLSSSTSFTDGT